MAKDNGKKKKSMPIYYDDGRTIADMSGLSGLKNHNREPGDNADPSFGRRASFKQQAKTYFAAVKMMFLPMLAMIGAICILFLILYIVLEIAG